MEHAGAVFGGAFVIAQTYVLGTMQDVNGIRKSAKKKQLSKIEFYSDATHCNDTSTSTINLINATANYYKHNDEWGNTWPNNLTTKTLADVGIDSNTEFPCYRAGIILFGEKHVWQFSLLREMITDWRKHVLSKYV